MPPLVERFRSSQFLRFAAVGVAGFAVDTVTLYAVHRLAGLDFYMARLFSYFAAATSTWLLNRRFTFAGSDRSAPGRQWLRFVGANGIGGVVNYVCYALIVWTGLAGNLGPLLGVAVGSVAGLAFNFTASRRFVFVAERRSPAGAGDDLTRSARGR